MSRCPFRVLAIGREHVLVFHPREGDDRMMLVDRVDEALLEQAEAEEQVLELHRRRDVLNDIYRKWGAPTGTREGEDTRPALDALDERKMP